MIGVLLVWWIFGGKVALCFLAGLIWQMMWHSCTTCPKPEEEKPVVYYEPGSRPC